MMNMITSITAVEYEYVNDEYELQVSQLLSMSMVNDNYELQAVEYEYGE